MKIIKNFSSYKNYEKIFEVGNPSPYLNSDEYQKAPNNVQQSIVSIRIAAHNAGTDERQLRAAFDQLKSQEDFETLNNFLKKYPKHAGLAGGYSSVEELLNGELEGDDYNTCADIADTLANIGVRMTYRQNPLVNTISLLPNSIKVPSQEKHIGEKDNLRVGRRLKGTTTTTPTTPETSKPNDDKEQANKSGTKGSVIPESKFIPKEKNSESVKLIQNGLLQVDQGKYKNMLGTADGQYGQKTLETVKTFQQDNNIKPVDGVFGPITSDILSVKLGEHIPPHGVKKRENPLPTTPEKSTKTEKAETPTTTKVQDQEPT
jgi:hypothetical protein